MMVATPSLCLAGVVGQDCFRRFNDQRHGGCRAVANNFQKKESPLIGHGVGELPLAGSGLFSGWPGISQAGSR